MFLMAINIKAGLNFVVATSNTAWNAVPFTIDDTVEIYGTINGSPVSWRPGRTINTLSGTGVVLDNGYMINSKVDRDLTAFFSPPVPIGGGGIVTME